MTSPSLVVVALLGSAQGGAQGMETKVTYTTSAASTGKVLQALSAQAGLNLATSPQTDGDVIAVRLQGVPAKDALTKIAWAVGGSWKKEGETYRLVRTGEEARAERAREQAEEIAAYTEALKKLGERLAKNAAFTRAQAEELAQKAATTIAKFDPSLDHDAAFYKSSGQIGAQAPAGRAIARVMALLNPRELADLPSGMKAVFSTHPTPTQRSLGREMAGIVADLQREQSLWMDAMSKFHVKNPVVGGRTFTVDGVQDADGPMDKVGKVLLVVNKSRYGDVTLQLLVANVKGKVLSRAYGSLPTRIAPAGKPPEVPKNDPKVVRPQDSEALSKVLISQLREPLPEALRQRLLNPEENEPLGLMGGATQIALATVRKANLVMALSETNLRAAMFGPKEVPATLYLHNLRTTYEVQDEGGWIVARPIAAATARQVRVDRGVLGQYARRRAQGKAMKVVEKAAWAARLPLEEDAPLPRTVGALVATNKVNDWYSGSDGRMLRLFGSLNPGQMASAKQGGLLLKRLNEEQLDLVKQLVYGEFVTLDPDPQRAQEAKIDVDLLRNGLMKEPTESLPNGIPPEGMLEIVENTEEVAFTEDGKVDGKVRLSEGFSPEQLAWQQFSQSRLDLFPDMNHPYFQTNFDRLRVGTRTSYTITICLTPIFLTVQRMEDREYGTGATVAYHGLSAEFRKKVDAAMENYRKSYGNRKPGTGTPIQASPPP